MSKKNILDIFGINNKKKEPIKIELPEGNSYIIFYESIPKNIRVNKQLFDELWNLHPEQVGQIKIMGKIINTPRYQQSYGKDYYFTGMVHKSLPISHEYIYKLLDFIKTHSGKEYNQVLINWYEDGRHYIGKHSDDEKQLVPNSDIYSFSFGQERDFVINSKQTDYKKTISLPNNSLVIMCGEMQKYYYHSVPKRENLKGRRINITFRLFKE